MDIDKTKTSAFASPAALLLVLVVFAAFWLLPAKYGRANTPQKKEPLRTIIVDNYHPYSYVNQKGEPDGFSVDLAWAVARVMGLDLKVDIGTWEQALAGLKSGRIDFLPMMAYSAKRDDAFDFSVPHTIAYDALFTRIDAPQPRSIFDLSGKKIIAMKDDQAHDHLVDMAKIPPEGLILVDSLPDALRLLASGKGDAALMPKLVGLTIRTELHLSNIAANPQVVEDYNRPFSFAVRQGDRALIERLGQGLSIVKNSGRYKQLYEKWFGAVASEPPSLKDTFAYIAVAGGVMAAIVALLMGWSLSLKKQVAARTRTLENEIAERRQTELELIASEEKFRNFAEQSIVGIYVVNAEGRFVYVNPKFAEIFGYTIEECLHSLSFRDLVHPDDLAVARENVRRRIAGDIAHSHYRLRGLKKGGEVIYGEVFGSSTLFEGQTAATGVYLDITERKRAEEALRESEIRFRELFDNMGAGVAIYESPDDGKHFVFKDLNRAGLQSGEKSKAEIVGREVREVFPGIEDLGLYDVFRRVWKTGVPEHHPSSHYKDDAIELWVENYVCKLPSGDLVAIYEDITARKKAEEAREKLEDRILQAQKMESIGNLAGGIAHDFNNILFPIIGLSELLAEDLPSGSREQKNAREILKAGRRGSDLVKQILAFSRQTEHKTMPVKIQQVLREVLKLVRSTIPSDIEISQDIEPDSGLVMADPVQIHQVAMNLITNAYHAVENDGGRITVTLRKTEVATGDRQNTGLTPGRYAVVSISDTGPGIDLAVREKIFEPYFTTKEPGKGTGLGLAVVYGIVKEHGGDIRVYSEAGKGTAFHVYLPAMDHFRETASAHPLPNQPTGTERILLVDDEEPIMRLEKQMLEKLGYRVDAFHRSLEALEAFRAAPEAYDLVITDMTMPNMTGDRLSQNLIAIRPEIPILICTGFSERLNRQKAEALGIKGFLMKPVVRSDLTRMIRDTLDAHKSRTGSA